MHKKLIIGAAALGLGFGSFAAAGSVSAAPSEKGACVQAGLGTLKELGALQDAARGQLDYSAFADPVDGPIFLDLPEGTFLSLGTVVKLHTTNPEYFAWCS